MKNLYYAHVLFDRHRSRAVKKLLAESWSRGISSIRRYGFGQERRWKTPRAAGLPCSCEWGPRPRGVNHMDVICHVITKPAGWCTSGDAGGVEPGSWRFRPLLLAGPGQPWTDREAHALEGVDVRGSPARSEKSVHSQICGRWNWSLRFDEIAAKDCAHPQFPGIPGELAAWLAGVPCIPHNTRVWCDASPAVVVIQ